MPGSERVYIYALKAPGAFKFGRSTNVQSRFRAVQGDNPTDLELYGHVTFHPWLEDAIHLELKAFRIRGEWFRPEPAVIEIAGWLREKNYRALCTLGHHVGLDFASMAMTRAEIVRG